MASSPLALRSRIEPLVRNVLYVCSVMLPALRKRVLQASGIRRGLETRRGPVIVPKTG